MQWKGKNNAVAEYFAFRLCAILFVYQHGVCSLLLLSLFIHVHTLSQYNCMFVSYCVQWWIMCCALWAEWTLNVASSPERKWSITTARWAAWSTSAIPLSYIPCTYIHTPCFEANLCLSPQTVVLAPSIKCSTPVINFFMPTTGDMQLQRWLCG